MTIFFESHQITIYRQHRIPDTNRFVMSATFTIYGADIQPASRERIEMISGRYGKVYTAFVDVTADIKENDEVQANGIKYSVKAISRWQGAGLLDHVELTLVAQD
jgi:ADP-dependent phosphofructokinase/glucokinase